MVPLPVSSRVLGAIVVVATLGGCSPAAICDEGYVRQKTNSSDKFWLCSDLCERCGLDGTAAGCEETDDWAHCVCGSAGVATWCEDANDEGMRCGEEECD